MRTLCLGYRELSEEEFLSWSDELEKAKTDLENKETLVPLVQEKLEGELILLGATAIEGILHNFFSIF